MEYPCVCEGVVWGGPCSKTLGFVLPILQYRQNKTNNAGRLEIKPDSQSEGVASAIRSTVHPADNSNQRKMDRRKLIKEAPYPPFSADLVPLLDDVQHAENQVVWEKDTNRRTSKRERRSREPKNRGAQYNRREYPYHPSSATPQSTYIEVQGSDDRLHSSEHYHPVTPVSLYGAIGGGGARKYPRAAALRFFLFSIGAIFFIIVMYAPTYKQARSRHASVVGWSYNTSRDTRFYVLPDNITVLHQPRSTCRLHDKSAHADSSDDRSKQSMPDDESGLIGTRDNKLSKRKEMSPADDDNDDVFLLVIVCSSMNHFAARSAIRETWGNQTNYELMAETFQNVTDRFAKINATDKILEEDEYTNNSFLSFFSFDRRKKRELSNVPEYAEDENEVDFQNESKYNSDSSLGDIKNEDSAIFYASSLYENSNSSDFEDSNSIHEGASKINASNAIVDSDNVIPSRGSPKRNDIIDKDVNTENSSNFDDITNESKDSDKVSNEEIISSMFDRVRVLEKLEIIENFKMFEYKRRHKRNVEDVSLDEAIAENKYVQKKTKKDEEDVQEAVDDPRFDHVDKKSEDLNEDDNVLGNFDGNNADQNDDVFEEYEEYQTEVSNIMRIPPRGEIVDNDNSDKAKSAVDTAKDLLKLSIKDNKLNLIVENSKDSVNNGENKPSNIKNKLKVSNDIKLKDVNLKSSTNDAKDITNQRVEDGKSIIKNINGKNINVHRIAKEKRTDESKYLHGGNVDDKKTSNNIEKVSPSDDIIYGEQIEFTPPVKTKFLFLLGRSAAENDTDLQLRIDEEAAQYGDLIQEGFVDSYNNLTLKSVMLLKWVVGNCGDRVRYVMKTDDDMFINIPRLVDALKNKSADYIKRMERRKSLAMKNSEKSKKKITSVAEQPSKETLLMGDLICDARPISDTSSKWYSPTYMFGGKVYPRYLSGTSYVMSIEAARLLYNAALDTPLFHLEDIYITGICSRKAGIRPIDNPGFSYMVRKPHPCAYWRSVTSHQVPPRQLISMQKSLLDKKVLTQCEVRRIEESRRAKGPTVASAAKQKSTKKISSCL